MTVGQLNAEAARRLKTAVSKLAEKDAEANKKLATSYSSSLDKLFPAKLKNDSGSGGWDKIKKFAADTVALDYSKVKWEKSGLLDSFKMMFMRLKCLKSIDPNQ